jgi:hypothetical protein
MSKELIKPVPKEGVTSKFKEDFIFTKAFDQIKDISKTLLRPLKPAGTDPFIAFEVIFRGEHVMGEAGPYRQFFADISMELQPSAINSSNKNLNLLIPSPNNASKLGEGRDKYVINPAAKNSYQIQIFEFLGLLMGCSVRTGTHFTLDLPQIFWKQLVGQSLSLEDLEEIDKPLVDLIKFLENCSKEMFEESFIENFTAMLSNNTVVELKKGGSKLKVIFEDRLDYLQRVITTRLRESFLQIEAIKHGLSSLIPLPFLNSKYC